MGRLWATPTAFFPAVFLPGWSPGKGGVVLSSRGGTKRKSLRFGGGGDPPVSGPVGSTFKVVTVMTRKRRRKMKRREGVKRTMIEDSRVRMRDLSGYGCVAVHVGRGLRKVFMVGENRVPIGLSEGRDDHMDQGEVGT